VNPFAAWDKRTARRIADWIRWNTFLYKLADQIEAGEHEKPFGPKPEFKKFLKRNK